MAAFFRPLGRHLASVAAAWAFVVALAVLGFVALGPSAGARAPLPPENVLDLVVEKPDGALAEYRFDVEVVDTDETRSKGLMFRKSMPADHGMLFDFRTEQPVWFWMKNTYIPLDMVFVGADGTVVSVAEDTTPLSEATISSRGAVRYVLEVNAGTAKRIGLKRGDAVRHARIMLGR